MSNELSVNTDGLTDAIPGLSALQERADGITSALVDRLNDLGAPWGGDEAGDQFFGQYNGPKNQLVAGISGIGNVIGDVVEGVNTMAKGFAQTEEENTASIQLGDDGGTTGTGDTGASGDR